MTLFVEFKVFEFGGNFNIFTPLSFFVRLLRFEQIDQAYENPRSEFARPSEEKYNYF